ncbi:uncharacterized protein FIBRA_05626 [Fibroporia radiculosa]|uniref:non-specific serine/threonine protein kinase n=1 Tax=Fibroporia radiculosa TaxID=599839 RepID=J4HXV0_9APHY|nr:uncharacterized protein FIBRA_05626 [Fibroporia radiculosa]CCM03492.1 predicted protein [Fibroporia radiculosa]
MSSHTQAQGEIIMDGQFDDAPEDGTPAPANPRSGHAYIDQDGLLDWSSESGDELDDVDAFEQEEDDMEAAAFHTLRAEDEDWEIAERDFTKQYNRIRQHVAVRTGAARGVVSSIDTRSAVASLPAVNRPRQTRAGGAKAAASGVLRANDKTADQLQALSKYSSRIRNIDMPYVLGVGVNRKGPSATANMKDKSDRATSEQVLDPRTRIILFKMIGRGLLFEVNGRHNPRKMVRLWAEKEMRNLKRLRAAGIPCPEPVEVRENVLVMGFVGDQEGWASPRLKDADIPNTALPDLYVELLRMVRRIFLECKLVHADLSEYNVLYYIKGSAPAFSHPEIDAPPPAAQTQETAAAETRSEGETEARGHLYIIDVSQSVEHDHPHAFDFLRSDLRNVEDFFEKRGVPCVGLRRAFEFVTRDALAPSVTPSSAEPSSKLADEEAVLRQWMEEPDTLPQTEVVVEGDESAPPVLGASAASVNAAHEDSVFLRSYIPRTLNEVYDPERDVGALSRGEGGDLIYKDMIGVVGPRENPGADGVEHRDDQTHLREQEGADGGWAAARGSLSVRFAREGAGDGADDEDADASSGSASDDAADEPDESGSSASHGNGEFEERRPRGHRHEDKDAKKERKKAVKEEAREKRKHKIPKAEKKRKVKTTARGG